MQAWIGAAGSQQGSSRRLAGGAGGGAALSLHATYVEKLPKNEHAQPLV